MFSKNNQEPQELEMKVFSISTELKKKRSNEIKRTKLLKNITQI
jgi:hypothetical protein